MEIIPAILSKDPWGVTELLEEIKKSGKFSRVQVDFIDGKYAGNKSIRVEEWKSISRPELKYDAHLMVVEKNIDEWARQAKEAGFDRIIAQMESVSRPEEFTALALDVHSPVVAIEPYLKNLELVVVMAVEPGFGGQKLDLEVMGKIRRLRDLRNLMKYKFKICVDGGVEKEMLDEFEKAGADEVAVGAKRVLSW